MKRKELITNLKRLGFKDVCIDDEKTLVAYEHIQTFLKSNHTPLKAVTNVYIDNGLLRVVIYDEIDLETDYALDFEYDYIY